MNENDFEKQLREDGFTEVEFQKLASRPGKGRHRHHFAIRGLVISGAFVVRQEGDPVVYGPGQIFRSPRANCTTSGLKPKAHM